MRAAIAWIAAGLLASAALGSAQAANQAPTVTLSAPTAGSAHYAPATISFAAGATDSDGTVAKVEFLNGSTVIAGSADTTSPYAFSWTNVAAGTYTVKARATDNLGKTGDSAAVTITVYPVTAVISSPANNSTVSGRAVTVTGTFGTPTDATVIVTGGAGHSVVATVSGSSFTAAEVELRPGTTNTIEIAIARPNGSSELKYLSVTAADPPVVVITGPAFCGPYAAPASVTFTADALSLQGTITKVEYFDNGALIGSATAAPFSLTKTLAVGTHTITAVATDSFGFLGTSAEPRVITVTSPPATATITSPANASTFAVGTPIPLTATASDPDGSVSRVDYYRAGNILIGGSSTGPSYSYSWTNAPAGNHQVTAIARDAGNAPGPASSPVSVSVTQNSPPTVSLTNPFNGATFNAPVDLTISATASDSNGSIAEVEFFAGALSLGKKTSTPYSLVWQNPPLGSHVLIARAKDNEGATTSSASATITVNGVTAAITAPANGATFAAPASFTLSATATTSSGTVTKVELFDGTTLLQTFNTSTSTVDINVGLSSVAAGVHSYTAKATDSGNRTSTSTAVSVTVTGPPTVTLTAPANGATFIAPATISLAADASATSGSVSKVEFFSGAALIGTVTTPPYQTTWNNVPGGTYSITAKVTDSVGASTSSTAATVNVTALTMAISSPATGASLQGVRALVRGNIQAPSNSGVMVNNYVAALAANGSFAVEIPLSAGSNQIVATVTTPSGQVTSQTISVNSNGIQPLVSITAAPLYATAPVTTKITVTNDGSSAVTTLIDGTTPGPNVLPGDSAIIEVTYSIPGSHPLLITATDSQSNVTSKEFVVVGVDNLHLEQMLRANWTGMLNALASGQKNAALGYLDPITAQRYGPVFDALLPQLSSIVSTFSAPVAGMITADFAEFIVNRTIQGVENAFFVYMLRNRDGVWRIGGM